MQKMQRTTRPSIKAISPLIATLILIAIAIVGGVVVYRLFFSSSGTVSQNLQVKIADVHLSSTGAFSVSLKNDGSVLVTTIAACRVSGPALGAVPITCTADFTNFPAAGLQPGQTTSATTDAPGPVTAGLKYTVSITVTGQNGQSYSTSITDVASF